MLDLQKSIQRYLKNLEKIHKALWRKDQVLPCEHNQTEMHDDDELGQKLK